MLQGERSTEGMKKERKKEERKKGGSSFLGMLKHVSRRLEMSSAELHSHVTNLEGSVVTSGFKN